MDPPVFAKYLPKVCRICIPLDVYTGQNYNYVRSLKVLAILLFTFSTISCLYIGRKHPQESLEKYHDVFGVLIFAFGEIFLALNKDQLCELIKYVVEPFERVEPNTVQSQIVEDYNRKINLIGKAAVVGYLVVAPLYSLAPLISYVFYSEELEQNECIDLAMGWVWTSKSPWHMILVHVASVTVTMMESFVLFFWDVIIACVLLKITCSIKLVCADLNDMNILLNWTEECLGSDRSGEKSMHLEEDGLMSTDSGPSVQINPPGKMEIIEWREKTGFIIHCAPEPEDIQINQEGKHNKEEIGNADSFIINIVPGPSTTHINQAGKQRNIVIEKNSKCNDSETSSTKLDSTVGKENVGRGNEMVFSIDSTPGQTEVQLNQPSKNEIYTRGTDMSYNVHTISTQSIPRKQNYQEDMIGMKNELDFHIHTELRSRIVQARKADNDEMLEENYSSNLNLLKSGREIIRNRLIQSYLKKIVERHTKIIKFVKLAEMTFRMYLLVFTQIGIISFSLIVPKISFGMDVMKVDYIHRVIEGFTIISQCGSLCYIGQTLLDESESLRQAIYNSDWVDKPYSLRRSLLIMQIMATRPLRLTIGGIYTLSLETFAKIINATYSYLSMIQSFK